MDSRINLVIETMNEKYSEPFSVKDMADVAALSPFHFNRVFQKATGVPPGRLLSAIRLSKAKQMLATTSLSVSDISYRVGYNSVGTFTTRFTASVGVSPTRFRAGKAMTTLERRPETALHAGAIRGLIRSRPGCRVRTVVVCAFDNPIAQGRPHAFTARHDMGEWGLRGIPPGECYVIAVAAVDCWAERERTAPVRDPAMVGRTGTLTVRSDAVTDVVIDLDPWLPTGLPFLSPVPCVTVACNGFCREPLVR